MFRHSSETTPIILEQQNTITEESNQQNLYFKHDNKIDYSSIENEFTRRLTEINPEHQKKLKSNFSLMHNNDINKYIDIVKLSDVIIQPKLIDADPKIQANNIFNEFNKNIRPSESCFKQRWWKGEIVNPDEFLLGARNKKAELSLFSGSLQIDRKYYPFNPTINTELIKRYKQTELFFGAYGSYVLNVPVNKFAKAWSGNMPVIYSPGPHVIHDQNFKFDVNAGLIDQSEPYIQHGSIHIVRVPAVPAEKHFATPPLHRR